MTLAISSYHVVRPGHMGIMNPGSHKGFTARRGTFLVLRPTRVLTPTSKGPLRSPPIVVEPKTPPLDGNRERELQDQT